MGLCCVKLCCAGTTLGGEGERTVEAHHRVLLVLVPVRLGLRERRSLLRRRRRLGHRRVRGRPLVLVWIEEMRDCVFGLRCSGRTFMIVLRDACVGRRMAVVETEEGGALAGLRIGYLSGFLGL